MTTSQARLGGVRAGALIAALALAQCAAWAQGNVVIPPPRGMLSDFASVIPAAQAARIEEIATFVRAKSGGEIAVVTLPDIKGREVGDIALRVGREWKVGAKADAGDARKNAGVVVLLVPKETSSDGNGHISITTGNGAEGFIPDAVAGDIRREATPLLRNRDYGSAMLLITQRVAERYAQNFGFALDSQAPPPPRRVAPRQTAPTWNFPPAWIILIVLWILLSLVRGRGPRGCLWMFLGLTRSGYSSRSRGGWYSGGGGFGGFSGGGGGGGFGGFGGGGGFSGGGSSGSF